MPEAARAPRLLIALVGVLALGLSSCAADDSTASTANDAPASAKGDKRPESAAKEAKHVKKGEDNRGERKPRPEPRPTKLRRYAVLDVVDGDTVKIAYRGETSVRIIGIDTPETVSPSVPDECWGPAASAAAARLLTGRSVTLTFDPSQGRLDRYGRTLGYLGIRGVGDYGLAMIKRGHAAELPGPTCP